MPKKFRSVNTKAEAARERKAAAKESAAEKKQREEEDLYWQDDDKHVARKQDRKVINNRNFRSQYRHFESMIMLSSSQVHLPMVSHSFRLSKAQCGVICM